MTLPVGGARPLAIAAPGGGLPPILRPVFPPDELGDYRFRQQGIRGFAKERRQHAVLEALDIDLQSAQPVQFLVPDDIQQWVHFGRYGTGVVDSGSPEIAPTLGKPYRVAGVADRAVQKPHSATTRNAPPQGRHGPQVEGDHSPRPRGAGRPRRAGDLPQPRGRLLRAPAVCRVVRPTCRKGARTLSDHLIAPHGGALVSLFADDDRCAALKAESRDWPSHDLTPRQLCDLELLANGAFSPLAGFLGRRDYDRVCAEMRLGDGTLWPMPITLDVPGRARVLAVARIAARAVR